MRDLIFVVTGFTIGHSLTLAFGGYRHPEATRLNISTHWSALTIALIGAENIVVQTRQPKVAALGVGACLCLDGFVSDFGIWRSAEPAARRRCYRELLVDLGQHTRCRPIEDLVTLVFGLIHGFGFAADLLQLQLPTQRLAELLVGFNLGVEVGQLALVVGATLLVLGSKRLQLALPRPIVVDVASAFLVALGVFWFVSRKLYA